MECPRCGFYWVANFGTDCEEAAFQYLEDLTCNHEFMPDENFGYVCSKCNLIKGFDGPAINF